MKPKYPGNRTALDGSTAVVAMETAASEGAGAYPITPSTQMGEGWALAVAAGETNVHGRRLLFFEPEGEHAAAAVTAGMSMVGLRATNFSSGQGIAYMHESLYAAVGKRLTYVLNVAARAMTKHALNVHAGHDDYHAIDDTGFFQLFAKNVQEAADFTLIAHRIAELSLNPGISAQDGFLTSHVIESLLLPERELHFDHFIVTAADNAQVVLNHAIAELAELLLQLLTNPLEQTRLVEAFLLGKGRSAEERTHEGSALHAVAQLDVARFIIRDLETIQCEHAQFFRDDVALCAGRQVTPDVCRRLVALNHEHAAFTQAGQRIRMAEHVWIRRQHHVDML